MMSKFLLIPLALIMLLVLLTLIMVATVVLALLTPLFMLAEPIDRPAARLHSVKYADYTTPI
ncbi:hypothetical protein [Spirosoma sordidisoli]|uniref:Uncharacterized protein n=1 Tax=Spirosoma sordidisoli TaxID=2502893 RepID=A0A4Q2UQ58_9BACT|nr:hypothetical protein [Spirosoma sordidisoli]RYC69770.1 hypothetical protein EQG79_14335 [Spirosoma sordidisoli]